MGIDPEPPDTRHDAPIVISDSGVGGLTVLRAISRRLPNENLIYLGDTAGIPYGTRSVETIRLYASQDAAFIESKNVKLIVVACNTASAIDTLVPGCTHYPILRRVITAVMGDWVYYVDSGEAAAEEVALLLNRLDLERVTSHNRIEKFYVTDAVSRFSRIAEVFLGRRIDSVELVGLGA